MMSEIEVASLVQIGSGVDGEEADTITVTTSAGSTALPQSVRGKYLRFYASAGTAYLTAGPDSVTPTADNGFEVATGTPESVYIPFGEGAYTLRHLGSESLTLKWIVTSK